jgi:hypothetical protein
MSTSNDTASITAGVTGGFALLMDMKRLISGVNSPVDSVVIGRSAAQPDGHGIDRVPGTPAVDQAERSAA